MDHPKTIELDARMKAMFDRIDAELEGRYRGRWALRRNRPGRGETSNPESDGLFNVGVFFDAGFSPGARRGYLVEVIIASEREVPPEERSRVEAEVESLLAELLPECFPERKLFLVREGTMLKIVGDFGLGGI